jgi:hypothetical protein
VSTDVSEEPIASIFRVEEISSARNQKASVISQKTILFTNFKLVSVKNPYYPYEDKQHGF